MEEKTKRNDSFSYTPTELKKWVEKGLVPLELLEPSMWKQLIIFLKENNECLLENTPKKNEEEKYKIVLPPSEEWKLGSDIDVVEKLTGKVVSVLEQVREFEMCKGIMLQVKSKEIDKWEKETAKAKSLTKKQNKQLQSFVEQFSSLRPLTRKEIVTAIEEIKKPLKKKYRQSGHLIDGKLKHNFPNNCKSMEVTPLTKQKIKESKLEVTAEGIKLTAPENKLIHALTSILHDKSVNNKNPKAKGYYKGNAPSEIVGYGESQKAESVVIKFKPTELYKAYTGNEKFSGADISFIKSVLFRLESKRVLIKYDRVKKMENGTTSTDRIEDFQPLINIKSFIPDLSEEEKRKLNKGDSSIRKAKGEIIIALNPIFTDQIDKKFIEYPVDTNRRLVIAAGGHRKVTPSMSLLMDWMLREKSAKRYFVEINEEKLAYILGLDKTLKQRQTKRIREKIARDIEAITNMGIILKSEKRPNSEGGLKWVFWIDKDYE